MTEDRVKPILKVIPIVTSQGGNAYELRHTDGVKSVTRCEGAKRGKWITVFYKLYKTLLVNNAEIKLPVCIACNGHDPIKLTSRHEPCHINFFETAVF